jgi:hypothetical protein
MTIFLHPPPVSQYKILIRDSAHLGVQDYGFYGSSTLYRGLVELEWEMRECVDDGEIRNRPAIDQTSPDLAPPPLPLARSAPLAPARSFFPCVNTYSRSIRTVYTVNDRVEVKILSNTCTSNFQLAGSGVRLILCLCLEY